MVSSPASATASTFMDLGAAVVREVAKMGAAGRAPRQTAHFDQEQVGVCRCVCVGVGWVVGWVGGWVGGWVVRWRCVWLGGGVRETTK